jgi:hypothetical protein
VTQPNQPTNTGGPETHSGTDDENEQPQGRNAGRYRKRPVVIEAMQWDGTAEDAGPVINWILANGPRAARYEDDWTVRPVGIYIDTLEGTMCASPGDFIIRGVQDEFYPCRSDIFVATYEEVPVGATHPEVAEWRASNPDSALPDTGLPEDGTRDRADLAVMFDHINDGREVGPLIGRHAIWQIMQATRTEFPAGDFDPTDKGAQIKVATRAGYRAGNTRLRMALHVMTAMLDTATSRTVDPA